MEEFKKHYLHAEDRVWPQSNCSVDLWIELLHSANVDPIAALSFTTTLDYEGDQFTFFKIPTLDIEELYGARLQELSIYDNVEQHVVRQVKRGNVVLVEVDGFYLPDTAGVSYQITHTKTTIGINFIDPENQVIGYFHNDIYRQLSGIDYINVLGKHGNLFPYCEFIKFVEVGHLDQHSLRILANNQLSEHLLRVPKRNPIAEFRSTFESHVAGLSEASFHEFAFNHFRMLGSNFELLGSFIGWQLPKQIHLAENCLEIAKAAKHLQFKTARMVAKSRFDPCNEYFDKMEEAYNIVIAGLNSRF